MPYMYKEYARQGHTLGMALENISAEGEIVVTIANSAGDPTPNYYSRRKGWIFPPADTWHWPEPPNDKQLISLLDSLRYEGAHWLGIVADQRQDFLNEHQNFAVYLQEHFPLAEETEHYAIYRIALSE
jgi:hypothetical protein